VTALALPRFSRDKLPSMKPFILLAAFALTACAAPTALEPNDSLGRFDYGAISHDPFWMVAIGGDAVVLTMGPEGGAADGELTSAAYPRAAPSERDGVRRWESGEGTAVIAVEARPGPCTTGGRSYPDQVKVYLSGRMLEGCGGQEIVQGRAG
jgi:uncharacterized membrane protein